MKRYPPEREEGNIEYKLKINDKKWKVEKIATQMKYRLAEGGGECFYVLGVSDDGVPEGLTDNEYFISLARLREAAKIINAKVMLIREKKGKRGKIAEVLIRSSREENPPIFLSITALGNVDAGKSTLISVLCTGKLDDGRGRAMKLIARYLHEIESGRTSSISEKVLGFKDKKLVNYDLLSPLNEREIFLTSNKVISFIDLGGHEKYFKTTLRGIMSRHPDYAMIVVGGNAGLLKMGREHLGVCIALKIPFFIVITKTDMAPKNSLEFVVSEITSILKLPGINKIALFVKDLDDVILAARHIVSGRVVPIFKISNVSGEGLELLLKFLNYIPPRISWKEYKQKYFRMHLEEIFNVKGVGPVVAGLVLSGSISEDESIQLGPFKDGSWRVVKIKSIQLNRVPTHRVWAGQYVTIALAGVKYNELEKGQALISKACSVRSVWRFKARLIVLRHPTHIKRGYQAVFHAHSIKSTVSFEKLEKEPMRTGDRGDVILRFLYHPWYANVGEVFMLREDRTKAIGIIKEIK